ncbi:hypothetical protein [Govanella unica]|uniref:BstA-like C-terminal domain-containing protein n=1 Tax=Govanella unica TaxID=2975056 RepID=A0A9X3TVK4_9PROT|nr:hypothetical protein [Govania unica]MDA5192815.1 hypothetical protein [Govania unica]
MSNGPKEITPKAIRINVLAAKSTGKEITPTQGVLPLGIEKAGDFGEIGMGVLSDGTPYLSQRGLAVLCGVENAHIGTISSQWNEGEPKPRIQKVKAILESAGLSASFAHVEIIHGGNKHYCYPAEVCLAILEYYAFDAGNNVQQQARQNFRLLAGSKLRDMIYQQVGYDPSGADRFKKWHDRIALNHQSAPKGYFHVFNEAHTIIYELIIAGAEIGAKTVVDISIGQHWGRYWEDNNLESEFGPRKKYPHRYPDDHPQAKSNPQESWCYPINALGPYRQWIQDEYIEGGKFKGYLDGKVKKGELPPSVAQLAIATLTNEALPAPQ